VEFRGTAIASYEGWIVANFKGESGHKPMATGREVLTLTRLLGFFEEQNMRQSKCVSRVLMGGILCVTLAGLVPMVYAQGGGGGAVSEAGSAIGGPAASGSATGSPGMGAPGAPPGAGTASDGSMTGGQPTNPVPNTPPSTGAMSEPGSNMGGSSTGSLGRNPTSRSGPTNPNNPVPGASGPAGSGTNP
jgi:hypothetical protein